MAKRTDVTPRKRPQQARSQATMATILDAATRVLVDEGSDAATTNRIAEVAGVSIGSLYQYFPNRDAILNALVDRHETKMLEQLGRMIVEVAGKPIEDGVRAYIKAMLANHASQPKLHQVITRQIVSFDLDKLRELQKRAESVVRIWLESHREEIRPKNIDLAAFILVSSIETVVHAAVLDRPEMLKDDAFAEEVTRLVVAYLEPLKKKPVARA